MIISELREYIINTYGYSPDEVTIISGIMGVPISFLDKYNPEQFEIIWRGGDIDWAESECDFYTPPTAVRANKFRIQDRTWRIQNPYMVDEDDNGHTVYQRIFIRWKR